VEKAVEGITSPLEPPRPCHRHLHELLRDQTQHATSLAEVRALSPSALLKLSVCGRLYQAESPDHRAGQKNGSIRADWSRAISPPCSGDCSTHGRVVSKSRIAWTGRVGGLLLRILSVRSTEASALKSAFLRTAMTPMGLSWLLHVLESFRLKAVIVDEFAVENQWLIDFTSTAV